MNLPYQDSSEKANHKPQYRRDETISKVIDFEQAKQAQSQRQWSKEHEVPLSTLQYWISRKQSINASPALVAFLESPDGLAFLHRLMTAAHFVFTKHGVASIHNVSEFFQLCGISPFVASSYPTQCRVSAKMDEEIIAFEQSERQRLSELMPKKKISLCEDETFHPQICLVAMEPVSNYILVEEYVPNREGDTWNNAVNQALAGLPVEVVQVASDEGAGLINHTLKGLKAHHSSDCFHVSYEIGKGTSGALAALVKRAEKEYEQTVKKTEKEKLHQQDYQALSKRPIGRPLDFQKRITVAYKQQQQADAELKQAKKNQETARKAKAEIGRVYHPFNLESGAKQDSPKVSQLLQACFERINESTLHLSDRCKKRVEKAHRVVNNMVATIAFFFTMTDIYMENLGVSEKERTLMSDYLIPGFYLQQAARKEKDTERKISISNKSRQLLSMANNQSGPFTGYSENDIERLKKASNECAQIFQRSSSPVEGRNAQLSLRHHGIHRLSDCHLKAQTAVHNYYIKRRDGTTPAERFFEAKHQDLFEWLLNRMDYPARPRKRMKKAA